MLAQGRWVTPGYFATMRIPLVAGEVCRDGGNHIHCHGESQFCEPVFRRIASHRAPPGSTRHHLCRTGVKFAASWVMPGRRDWTANRLPRVYWCATNISPGSFFLGADVRRAKVHGRNSPPQDPRVRAPPVGVRSAHRCPTTFRMRTRSTVCAPFCSRSSQSRRCRWHA